MKLPRVVVCFLLNRLFPRVERPVDQYIGGPDRPYLKRWFVIPRNPFFNIYFHSIHRSDDDRALHDHPWVNCSIVLLGCYIEHSIAAGGIHYRVKRTAGDIVFRRAMAAHRLELGPERYCFSLFMTGPKIRSWGFHCGSRWVHWRDFVDPTDTGRVGPGCGEEAE